MEPESKYAEKPTMMRTTAPHGQLSNCVFLIEREDRPGRHLPVGTGFVIGVDDIHYGVTARHVLQEQDEDTSEWGDLIQPLSIRVVRQDSDQASASVRKRLNSRWFSYTDMYVFHQDSAVDVALFPIYYHRDVPERTLALGLPLLQPDERVLVGEDVHLFGFPGVYGYREGTPVIRSGTVCYKLSSHAYLLDITSWHGDSGGLVCSKPYFGVPEGQPSGWQWHAGGKVIGLLQGYQSPAVFGLPNDLEPFRVMTSAQAIIETFHSLGFKTLHARLMDIAQCEPD